MRKDYIFYEVDNLVLMDNVDDRIRVYAKTGMGGVERIAIVDPNELLLALIIYTMENNGN